MDASGLWSFVCSINFQLRQFPATNQHISCKESLLLYRSRFLKETIILFWFEILLPQTIKEKETYFSTRKILQNFEGHDHWYCPYTTFWVIYFSSKWVRWCCWNMSINLILPAGYFLDLCSVWLSNTAPFFENYTRLVLMQNT